ncbi:MAG: hypothetical protein IGQ45_01835 [Cyanobacterium sp. T60_A2020_053]|nr:hypothetical protein [Cyanobacterium sp. T60_A2020_053]
MRLRQLTISKLTLSLPCLTMMGFIGVNYQPLSAQNLQVIDISPYNQTPTDDDSFNLSPDFVPPLPQKLPSRDTLVIEGNSRPAPVAPITGKMVNSQQNLPSPPRLSEPYSAPPSVSPSNQTPSRATITNTQPASVLPQITPSADASPYDYTPSDNPTVATPTVNVPQTAPSNAIPRPNSSAPRNTNQRRDLKEILVFDTITVSPEVIEQHRQSRVSNNNLSGSFRVLVGVKNSSEETRLKSLYPNAFRTTHQGQTLWQIGVFSNRQNADNAAQPLKGAGLNPIITPVR